MEERLKQIEADLDRLLMIVDEQGAELISLRREIRSRSTAETANPNAGGQYREQLIEFFDAHPNEWYSPGGIAKLLGYGKGHPVSIGQSCRGLVKSGVLVSSTDPVTERLRFKKA